MNAEELKANFQPREVETQIEFENYMTELNNEQTLANHPYIDQLDKLNRCMLAIQQGIKIFQTEIDGLRMQKLDIAAKQKEINRACHELKHEMIRLNPREKFVKPEETTTNKIR